MRYLFIFTTAIILSASAFAQKKQFQVIAVASYNCENFFEPVPGPKHDEGFTPNGQYHYTWDIYKQKQHNIATVIQKIATDVTPDGAAVVGLVEVENSTVLKDLVDQPELKDRNYKYVWFPTSDERGISTAMLYNPKYFYLIDANKIIVDLTQVGQHRPTRDILHVYGVLAGDTVHIFVNHWPSKSGGEAASEPGRLLAAGIDKKYTDSLLKADPNTKFLLLGDLNDNPTSAGVMNVLQAKADRADVQLTDIYNPWINIYKKGMGSESYQHQWNLIDQIMLSGSFIKNNNHMWQYYRCEIYNPSWLNNKLGRDAGLPHRSFTINSVWDNGYSDHYPVIVYLLKEKK